MTRYEGTFEGRHIQSLYPELYRVRYTTVIAGRTYDVDDVTSALDEAHARERAHATIDREAFRFMREHSGYVVGKRALGALQLARAERALRDAVEAGEARVTWQEDPEPYDHGDGTEAELRESARIVERLGVYGCSVERLRPVCEVCGRGPDWDHVASVWGVVGDQDYATSSLAITLANDRGLREAAQSLDVGDLLALADGLKDWVEGIPAIDDASAGVPEGPGLVRAALVRAGFSEVEWREVAEYVRVWDQ